MAVVGGLGPNGRTEYGLGRSGAHVTLNLTFYIRRAVQ